MRSKRNGVVARAHKLISHRQVELGTAQVLGGGKRGPHLPSPDLQTHPLTCCVGQ